MAEQQVWLGSVGPFLYDDASFFAIRTTGQQRVDTAPTADTHVLRRMDLASMAWPIGSVFIAVVSTNPGTLLGFGTWSAFGTGRVLVGINPADVDFDTVEETGGAKTVAAAGTVSQPTFTGNALATHTHSADGILATDTNAALNNNSQEVQMGVGVTVAAHTHSHSHSHDVTGDTSATGAGTPSGTVSQPTFTGSATSVVQPYIVVYMWKRTA